MGLSVGRQSRSIAAQITTRARPWAGHCHAAWALQLTVTNPATDSGGPRPAGGHGLIGMRERATLLGGTLEAHRVDGAFRVSARIPYGASHA